MALANLLLDHNTIVETTSTSGGAFSPGQVTIRDNIMSYTRGTGIGNRTMGHDHNLFYATASSTHVKNGSLAATDKTGNPQFINLADRDVHLTSTSIARAAGSDGSDLGALAE